MRVVKYIVVTTLSWAKHEMSDALAETSLAELVMTSPDYRCLVKLNNFPIEGINEQITRDMQTL